MNRSILSIAAVAVAFLSSTACEIDGGFLFPDQIDGVPGVIDIKSQNGGPIVPVDITSPADAAAATIYAEVGPNDNALPSGATFEFIGTGGDVCAFVDPELVFWNQSVSQIAPETRFRFPDNPYDDGDMDMYAGLTVYYRGTPGEEMGGFEVQYTDDLGNDVEVSLVSCSTGGGDTNGSGQIDFHAGRGTPEYCTIRNTQPGVSYTVALQAFSLPFDDARLGFGIVLANGECDGSPTSLTAVAAPNSPTDTLAVNEECIVVGESLSPDPIDEANPLIKYGYAEGRSWAGSEEFEQVYCAADADLPRLNQFCNQEIRRMTEDGLECDYVGVSLENPDQRCFCGDRNETPNPGARR